MQNRWKSVAPTPQWRFVKKTHSEAPRKVDLRWIAYSSIRHRWYFCYYSILAYRIQNFARFWPHVAGFEIEKTQRWAKQEIRERWWNGIFGNIALATLYAASMFSDTSHFQRSFFIQLPAWLRIEKFCISPLLEVKVNKIHLWSESRKLLKVFGTQIWLKSINASSF